VHFERAHEFAGTVGAVARIMSDPEFQAGLELPDLSRPSVVTSSAEGTTRRLRLRY